ncbi:MAG: hypothetical protein GY765_35730 [bacterium]|nr:hypothetical protein [bacterium]
MKKIILFVAFVFLPLAGILAQTPEPAKQPVEYLGMTPPGETPEVFAPGLISGPKMELMISFSRDGKLCTFFRASENVNISEMNYMRRTAKGWSKPAPIPYLDNKLDGYYILAPRGYKMYFASLRPLPGTTTKLKKRKPWEMDFVDNAWQKPRLLDFLSHTNHIVGHPSFTDDGTIYFYDDLEIEGGTQADIFYARFKNGKFGPVQNPGKGINNKAYDECDGFIDPKERFLLYAVRGNPACLGDLDIFISYRKADGTWSKGISMGPKINSAAREIYPRVSPDGKYFFFGSNKSGNWDIYWCTADIIEKLKPPATPGGGSRASGTPPRGAPAARGKAFR